MKQVVLKQMKWKLVFVLFLGVLFSCSENLPQESVAESYQCPMKCEAEKVYTAAGSCPVCKMDLKPTPDEIVQKELNESEISEMSIFNLNSKWKTEEDKEIVLKDLNGQTTVMVMIYTTCKAACPRLVADMRNIESKITETKPEGPVSYVLVSINPETDTPEILKAFAIENQMDGEQWTFLQGTVDDVRELANVLAVKYKEISPIDFSHSNIISVFDPKGELVHQQEGLGVDNEETVAVIIETANKN